MNFKVLFITVAIIISMVASSTGFIFKLKSDCVEKTICDTRGNTYPSNCAFEKAQKKNGNLQQAACNGNSNGEVEYIVYK